MSKESKWQFVTSVWGVIVIVSVILGVISSILQISGTVDLWGILVLALISFLTYSVPIYSVILFIGAVILALFLLLLSFGSYGSNILDDEYGRHLAILCQEARTTEYLRQKLKNWLRRDGLSGGYSIDDYLKLLENQGYLEYLNGRWEVTDKALDYVEKYHGS